MSKYILGYPISVGSTKGAIEFLEENIDLIDTNNWEDFFWNMLDNPAGWSVANITAQTIIGMLNNGKILFDEEVRQKVLYEALNNTITALYDSDITNIDLFHLYYPDNGSSTLSREDMGNWLGYSAKEFVQFIKDNPSLKIRLVREGQSMHTTLFEVLS